MRRYFRYQEKPWESSTNFINDIIIMQIREFVRMLSSLLLSITASEGRGIARGRRVVRSPRGTEFKGRQNEHFKRKGMILCAQNILHYCDKIKGNTITFIISFRGSHCDYSSSALKNLPTSASEVVEMTS